MPELDLIRRAFARHQAATTPCGEGCRRASVALVLAGEVDALSLCFIHRADVPGDRWSGQMALPGGRADAGDVDAAATAVRETREEVGLELDGCKHLGALAEQHLSRPGLDVTMVLSELVFYLGSELPALRPNYEVAAAFWIPLAHLWDPGNATRYEVRHDGQLQRYPGIRFGEQVIWGLTFRVLMMFAEVVGRPLPRPDDR